MVAGTRGGHGIKSSGIDTKQLVPAARRGSADDRAHELFDSIPERAGGSEHSRQVVLIAPEAMISKDDDPGAQELGGAADP